MSRGEYTSFSWRPDSPVRSFRCKVLTDAESLGAREYAVAVSALDAEGAEVEPTSTDWSYSRVIGSRFSYTPESASGVAPSSRWESDVFADRFDIRVVSWIVPDPDDVHVTGIAVASDDGTNSQDAVWTVLTAETALETEEQHG